jgi:hypothetical protein
VARVLAPDTPEIEIADHENCPHTTLNQEGMDWPEEISDDSEIEDWNNNPEQIKKVWGHYPIQE